VSWRLAARWIVLGALVALASAACGAVRLPSPELFGGLIGGVAVALGTGWCLVVPRAAVSGAQGVIGVAIGAYVQASTIRALGHDLIPVLGVCLATLLLTVVAGLVLARVTDLDRATAAFGMIAGGASGIIAVADDLGADNRLVAVLQYLRVLAIIVLAPLVTSLVFPGARTGGSFGAAPAASSPGDVALFLALSLAVGVLAARAVRLPARWLLGPMLVAAGLALAGAPFAGAVPAWLQRLAFAAIGLQVGLRFTTESLRAAGRALLPGLAMILALIAACALLGVALAGAAHVSELDGYLATTPGGLYVVLATAVGSGADTTFVLAVQVLRLFAMLLAAPLLARWLVGRAGGGRVRPVEPASLDPGRSSSTTPARPR
jgi:uncharacterized protein